MKANKRLVWAAIAAALLAGCASTPPTSVHQPMSVRPEARTGVAANGAIYQAGAMRPLLEDRRARYVGDTLIINIVEKTQAAAKSNANTDRSQSASMSIPTLTGLNGVPGMNSVAKLGLEANSANKFEGKGESGANNTFTGTITVTVIDVYPNGNLLVSGEKQVSIAHGTEYIRFSGVVNPNQVTTANTVNSTQVADARVEYKQSGFVGEATDMGWLARFFLNVLPF